jgi:hypothetical protein
MNYFYFQQVWVLNFCSLLVVEVQMNYFHLMVVELKRMVVEVEVELPPMLLHLQLHLPQMKQPHLLHHLPPKKLLHLPHLRLLN